MAVTATSSSTGNVTPQVIAEILGGDRMSLSNAAKLFPGGRQDKPMSPSCIWRWIRDGIRSDGGVRVRLEAARVGKRWHTSAAACRRFVLAMNGVAEESMERALPKSEVRPHTVAEGELRRRGV